MPAPDGGDDFVWIGGPSERVGVFVVLFEEAIVGGLQVDDGAEYSAFQSAQANSSPRLDEEAPSKGMLIGYARVSTVDQNLALQRDALNEAGCRKIFTEQLSGAVIDRPALHDALEFARSGDTLIVWKLDRLARSMKQLIETIEKLRLRNIGFRSLTEALDSTTAQGRLVFHMFGALAEFERSLIRERTQAGLAAARGIGRTGGRPPKLTDDDIEAAKAMLANPDIGVTQIAHRLGVSPATLYRYIPAARTAYVLEE